MDRINSSLGLIENYFTNRSQTVKYKGVNSSFEPINLDVPEGSILGPLINDLAFLMEEVKLTCKMFADDTSLYDTGDDLKNLISKMQDKLKHHIECCFYNKLDINWKKTFFMFVTNKRIKNQLPKTIIVNG